FPIHTQLFTQISSSPKRRRADELNPKQKEVLARRFGLLGYEPSTLEEVGREINLTRERVRQIQVEGLRRLREILVKQGLNMEALFNVEYD
ncbi:sigma factor-like helix-turn-helix DNA-binding protein, partial [Vibrio anguillarum]|uniref:sigma factor-like helix-turn-helix DNA-binding protein n=1 Tax=Vibrio anguillarum TaxID=55601 RepID=UPI000A3E6A9D